MSYMKNLREREKLRLGAMIKQLDLDVEAAERTGDAALVTLLHGRRLFAVEELITVDTRLVDLGS